MDPYGVSSVVYAPPPGAAAHPEVMLAPQIGRHFVERLEIGLRHWLTVEVTFNAPTMSTSVAWSGTTYYVLWLGDDLEDEDGQKSRSPSTWYYFSTVLWWLQSSDWILRPSKNCWVFGLETFSMQLRNYQKSMGPGPITNTRHFAKFCTIYFPWFSLSITVIHL